MPVGQVVLLTHSIDAEAMLLLSSVAEVRILPQPDEAGLLREIPEVDALLVRMPVSAEAIRAGKRLRVVARHGVGLDYIPVDVCTELGIPVTFTPDANTEFRRRARHRQHDRTGASNWVGGSRRPTGKLVVARWKRRPRPVRAYAGHHRVWAHRIKGL